MNKIENKNQTESNGNILLLFFFILNQYLTIDEIINCPEISVQSNKKKFDSSKVKSRNQELEKIFLVFLCVFFFQTRKKNTGNDKNKNSDIVLVFFCFWFLFGFKQLQNRRIKLGYKKEKKYKRKIVMHRFIFSLPEFCLIQHYKTFQVDYISLKFSKFCLKAMENI